MLPFGRVQIADADRNQEASDNRFTPAASYVFIDRDSPEYYVIALLEKRDFGSGTSSQPPSTSAASA